MKIYFEKSSDPVEVFVVNDAAARRQILNAMQDVGKAVIGFEERITGNMLIVDTRKITMVV